GMIQSSHGATAAMNRPGSATPLMRPRMPRNVSEITVTARSSSTVIYSTSTIISISTGICIGSEPMPTAERACLPICSPNTSTMRSEKPFMTLGCSPKSSVAFTMPSTFTMRLTLSRLPSCVRTVARRFSPTSRATCAPCSVERSLPTLPRAVILPSAVRVGPWPDTNRRLPTRTAPTRWCTGLEAEAAAKTLGLEDTELALAHWIGVIRETFEEVGVLLATSADGGPVRVAPSTLTACRRACQADNRAFWELVKREDLRLATDRLVYFAHWITPEGNPLRFDTRFFAAPMPPDQTPTSDDKEVTDLRWLAPAEALEP